MLFSKHTMTVANREASVSESSVFSDTSVDENTSESNYAKDVESEVDQKHVADWKPSKQEWFIMSSLSMISLVVALDATILVTVLPAIAKALNGNSVNAFWAGTSYLLSSAVSQPIIASISELFGRQQLLLIALFFFTLGTFFCSIAPDFALLLIGRSVQGIGGGGIITMGQVIFCDIVPLRVRPKYFSMVLGSWAVGSIIGPVIGGVLVEHTSWRWVFYINFPFCVLGFILAIVFVRLSSNTTFTLTEKLKRTDWIGAILFLGGTTSFLIGLSWGGIQYPWKSVQALAPIVAGLAAIVVFVIVQRWKAPRSLLPMSIFYCPSALAAFYCAIVNGFLLFTALYYLPFYTLSVCSKTPTQAGIDLFPALFFLLPGSIIVASLTARLGRFRWAIWIGWAFSTVACGLLILLDEHTSTAVWATILAVLGIGTGMVLTSVNVGIQAISTVEHSAMAASMYGFMRSLGMPIGVALSGTVFQNAMASKLKSFGLPESIAHDSERYVYVLRSMEATNPFRAGIVESYLHGFRSVWILMTAMAGSALLVSCVIRKFSMDKGLQSSFTAR